MAKYQRKTADEWRVMVNYGQGWEHELTEDSRAAAVQQRRDYRANCPEYPVRIVKRRIPIQTTRRG